MKDLEKRSFSFEVGTEDGRTLLGRPIVYGSRTDLGWYDEIIEAGALDNADLKDVRFLVNHDLSKIPLARSRRNNANSTMQLSPNSEGMDIRVTLDVENNADARALYSAVERRDISGMSFMFSVGDEEWEDLDTDHPTRHIRAISSVVEVSAVTFPAYEDTQIEARSALESARQAVETARARSVDTDLELLKEKTKILGGI